MTKWLIRMFAPIVIAAAVVVVIPITHAQMPQGRLGQNPSEMPEDVHSAKAPRCSIATIAAAWPPASDLADATPRAPACGTNPTSLITFFGPDDFVRGKGKPVVETKLISTKGFDRPFVLNVRNGDSDGTHRVSSAVVKVGRSVVVAENEFIRKFAGTRVLIELQDPSLLSVWLAGEPGAKLTIWIDGKLKKYVSTLDAVDAVQGNISSSGGELECSLPSVHFKLVVPPNALLDPTEISMTPITQINGATLPNGEFTAAVQLSPDGLRFLKPVTLTIETSGTAGQPPKAGSSSGSLGGFLMQNDGYGYHPYPAVTGNSPHVVSLQLMHFTDGGAMPVNCASPPPNNPTLTPEQAAEADLAMAVQCGPGSVSCARLKQDLTNWMSAIVARAQNATTYTDIFNVTNEYLAWRKWVESYAEPVCSWDLSRTDELEGQGLSAIEAAIIARNTAIENACASGGDRTDLINESLKLQALADLLGLNGIVFVTQSLCPRNFFGSVSVFIRGIEYDLNVSGTIGATSGTGVASGLVIYPSPPSGVAPNMPDGRYATTAGLGAFSLVINKGTVTGTSDGWPAMSFYGVLTPTALEGVVTVTDSGFSSTDTVIWLVN